MENKSYAQKLIELAEALGLEKIIDDKVYTLDDIKKMTDDEIVEALETQVIDILETEKHYPSTLAIDINEIYEKFYDKEDMVLDYKYDLNIED